MPPSQALPPSLLTTIEWIHLITDVTIPEPPKVDMANVDKLLWDENSPGASDALYGFSTISLLEKLLSKTLKLNLAPTKTEEGAPDAKEWLEVSEEHCAALDHIDNTLTAVQRFLPHLVSKINSEHHALLNRLNDDVKALKREKEVLGAAAAAAVVVQEVVAEEAAVVADLMPPFFAQHPANAPFPTRPLQSLQLLPLLPQSNLHRIHRLNIVQRHHSILTPNSPPTRMTMLNSFSHMAI